MKVILFTSSFPYGSGEQFLETEIEILAKRFNEIIIFPCVYGNTQEQREVPDNVSVQSPIIQSFLGRFFNLKFTLCFKNIKNTRLVLSDFKRAIFSGNIKSFIVALNASYCSLGDKRLTAILKETNDQDILYFFWGNGISYILPFIGSVLGKIVLRLHGSDLYEYLYNNYLPFRYEQLDRCDYIVPISKYGVSYLSLRYPYFKHKIILSRLGINSGTCLKKKNSKYFHIVSCSSLNTIKRVHLIVDILKNIKNIHIKWTHIGTGEMKTIIEEKATALPSNIIVNFKGQMNNRDVISFYKNNWVDLFINVSQTEGIPVSIMEAFSFGIPCIATDVGGTSEIVNKNNGILLKKNFDTYEASKLIKDLIERKIKLSRKQVLHDCEDRFNAQKNYNDFCELLRKPKT